MDTASAIAKVHEVYMGRPASIARWTVATSLMGAAQLAIIKNQQPPTMAEGGLIGGNLHSQGGTMVNAERGEYVIKRSAVEAVGLETLNRINRGDTGSGSVNISFQGNVLSEDFIEDEAIPRIKEAIRRGADIGIG